MKKITFLFLALLLQTVASFGQVQIGNGTATNAIPLATNWGYSYSQSIYLASEINAPAGDITGLQWYFHGGSDLSNAQDIVIYMAHTDKTSFTDGEDWFAGEELTQVYNGGITVNGAGWVTLTFDTPFEYNGTDNLVIAAEDNMEEYNGYSPFHSTNVSNARSIYYFNDNTNPEPGNPPYGNTLTYIPNVILNGISQSCPPVTNLTVGTLGTTTATVGWTESGDATEWTVEYGAPGFTQGEGEQVTASGTSETVLENLTSGTEYEFLVRANCSDDDQSVWSFTRGEFTTNCAAVDDFVFNFNASSTFPICLDALYENADNTAYMSTYYESSGDNSLVMYNFSSDNQADIILVTPEVNTIAAGTHWLTFSARANDLELIEVGTITDPSDASTFESIEFIPLTEDFTTYTVSFQDYEGTNNYIALKRTSNFTNSSVYVDDFTFEEEPSCIYPINVTASNVTADALSFEWDGDATSYEYVLSTSEETPTEEGTTITNATVTFNNLMPSTTYYLYVRTICDAANTSEWVSYSVTTTIANNLCENAVAITASTYPNADASIAGTTANATNTIITDCNENYSDVWYSFTPETTGQYYINSGYSSVYITVLEGTCGNLTELSEGCRASGIITFTAGETYYIAARAYYPSTYTFDLSVQLMPAAPENDSCATATSVSEFPYEITQDASGATNNDGIIATCTSGYGMNDGVWYTFTPVLGGTVNLSIEDIDSSLWDAEINVFSGSCGEFTCEGSSYGYSITSLSLDVDVTAGTTYYVLIGNNDGTYNALEGEFTLSIDSDDASLATTSFAEATGFEYYPNPVKDGALYLTANSTIDAVTVYNVVGQEVLALTPATTAYALDMHSLTAGSYFVTVTIDGATETVKVMKP